MNGAFKLGSFVSSGSFAGHTKTIVVRKFEEEVRRGEEVRISRAGEKEGGREGGVRKRKEEREEGGKAREEKSREE